MNKVKEFFNKKRAILYAALALLLVAAISAGFGISAKYRKDVNISGTLKVSSGIAKKISIQEYKAEGNADGYTLENNKVNENSFIIMPGTSLPRDPFVEITGKTDTPAYIYVEVKNTLPEAVSFELASDWTKLEGVIGSNGGQVYVLGTAPSTSSVGEGGNATIHILNNNSITVGSGFEAAEEVYNLNFYLYVIKAEGEQTAAQAFSAEVSNVGTVGTYTPGAANAPDVVKETDGTVDVENNDDQSVYVRAAVIVNWKMEDDGSFFGSNPVEDMDYTFTSGNDWFKAADGFYYYSNPVPAGQEAPDLIKLFTPVEGRAPEGCTLSVTVSVQTIQAAGGAVTGEWGCTVNADGTITKE